MLSLFNETNTIQKETNKNFNIGFGNTGFVIIGNDSFFGNID
jgi:hypothetical protein